MDGNTWKGQAQEVLFTNTYTSSWPESNANKHIQISKVKITVAPSTGIQSFNSQYSEAENTYTLSGRRIDDNALTKGVYIKKGKKLIIQ